MAFRQMKSPIILHGIYGVGISVLLIWLAVAALLPSLALPIPVNLYDQKRFFQIGLLVLTGFFMAPMLWNNARIDFDPIVLSAISFIIFFGFISAATSSVPMYAAAEVSMVFLVLFSILFLSVLFGSIFRFFSVFVFPLLALGAIFYSAAILGIVWGDLFVSMESRWPDKVYNFSNRRFMNQWQSWILPLLPFLLYSLFPRCRKSYSFFLIFIAFSLLWAMLFYSLGRAVLFAQLALIIIMPIFFGRRSLMWLSFHLSAALIGLFFCMTILGINFFDPQIDAPVDRLASLQDQPRLEMILLSFLFVEESPFLGVGPMHFAAAQNFVAAHPHNSVMQLMAEWGIPAALAFAILVFWPLYRWLVFASRKVRTGTLEIQDEMLIMSLTASMMSAGMHSLVSGIIVMPMSLIMLVLVMSLSLAIYRTEHPTSYVYNPLVRRVLAVTAIVMAVGLGSFAIIEGSRQSAYRAADHPFLGTHLQPRFWQQGNLFHLMDEEPRVFPRGALVNKRFDTETSDRENVVDAYEY